MKFLAAMVALFIAAQPLQAAFCPMEGQASGVPAAQHGMSHHSDKAVGSHDCCKQKAPERDHDCSNGNHCGACAPGSAAELPRMATVQPPESSYRFAAVESGLTPSHSTPPFRPPIFNS